MSDVFEADRQRNRAWAAEILADYGYREALPAMREVARRMRLADNGPYSKVDHSIERLESPCGSLLATANGKPRMCRGPDALKSLALAVGIQRIRLAFRNGEARELWSQIEQSRITPERRANEYRYHFPFGFPRDGLIFLFRNGAEARLFAVDNDLVVWQDNTRMDAHHVVVFENPRLVRDLVRSLQEARARR